MSDDFDEGTQVNRQSAQQPDLTDLQPISSAATSANLGRPRRSCRRWRPSISSRNSTRPRTRATRLLRSSEPESMDRRFLISRWSRPR